MTLRATSGVPRLNEGDTCSPAQIASSSLCLGYTRLPHNALPGILVYFGRTLRPLHRSTFFLP
ncbi:hypothetical protein DICSQDRAFT_135217 [Dichomitus squalens LYAD-421 SS1]|uniref:uncharacterized protein n=1 Tax=Dichomitus squalens (strain LYAD-421) TaxID=732165 RepID=UPI0004415181|nr:uncharacterized protein DICSQDRAFT_135217 [Dichomitus squalens LYAD-421 SS1]EJF62963.1 hypothetical protein DICSQDRAFT_135217 [Dichomitus squalens LYAD-421 SS1]